MLSPFLVWSLPDTAAVIAVATLTLAASGNRWTVFFALMVAALVTTGIDL